MLLRELNELTNEEATAARAVVFCGGLHGGWTVYVNGNALHTVLDRARVFSSLESVAKVLRRAGIQSFTVDIASGHWVPVLPVPPQEQLNRVLDAFEDAPHTIGEKE